MKIRALKSLIMKGESQTLDFKKTITHVYKIAKTITSFANTKGGVILVGVMDNKQIVGIDPEEEMYLLEEAAKHYCDPPIQLTYTKVEDDEGNIVLVTSVPNSEYKPHTSLDLNDNWNVYVRMNDKSVVASKLVVNMLSQESAKDKDIEQKSLSPQEQTVMVFLKKYERITVKQYAKLINISERRAKRILITLSQKGLLLLHDLEKEDFYSLA